MLKVDLRKIILKTNAANREILCDVGFTIGEQKIYTILGKNGSGKSTLIKSLTGLLDKDIYTIDGNVFWYDEDIFKMSVARLLEIRKKEIKYVLQDLTKNYDPLKKLKYYFNISSLDENTISLQLKSFLLPDYKTISNLYPYEISGGMAQRLSLMLAISSCPKLLILDEPTSAIDYVNINLIKLKLFEFKKTAGSALIVTQDINFAKEISDEIAYLHNNNLSEFMEVDYFFEDNKQSSYGGFLKSFKDLQ